jgi:hypothetical protein
MQMRTPKPATVISAATLFVALYASAVLVAPDSSSAKKKSKPSIAGTYKGTTQDGPPGPYPLAGQVSKNGVVTGLRTTLLIYGCDGVITRSVNVPVPIQLERKTPWKYETEWTGRDADPNHRLKVKLKLDVVNRILYGSIHTEDTTKFDPEQGYMCFGRTDFELKGKKPRKRKKRK